MSWVDALVPELKNKNPALDAFQRLAFSNRGRKVDLGPLDLASLSVVQQALLSSKDLLLQFPRGRNDMAILCGLFVQLMRLTGRRGAPGGLDFHGPVVVIALDSLVQQRLAGLRMANISLGEGLNPCRVRYDGLAVDVQGKLQVPGRARDGLLYLNTRVGWPRLRGTDQAGIVIVDRTSFGDGEILDRALAWAEDHRARSIVVVSDLGDRDTQDVAVNSKRGFRIWPWAHHLVSEVVHVAGRVPADSSLSTNALLWQDWDLPEVVVCQAAAVDERLQTCIALISRGAKIEAPIPRSVVAARKLVNGLARSLSTTDEYNQWASLDHRTTSFASLRNVVEGGGSNDFTGQWVAAKETIWIPLRYEVLKLYDLVRDENPKLFGLAYAIERLQQDDANVPIVIRVPSEAAGQAMQSDLLDFKIHCDRETGPLQWAPLSTRKPWCSSPATEVLPGAVAPWWGSLLWSSEATRRLHLTYPYEARMLSAAVRTGLHQQATAVASAFQAFHLVAPSAPSSQSLKQAYLLDVDQRPDSGMPREQPDLKVNANLLFDEIEVDEGSELPRDHGAAVGAITARGIELEPGGEVWWLRDEGSVEVLMNRKHLYLPIAELRPGNTVIVPRGEGREGLFTRLVKVVHGTGDIAAFEVFLSRWRHACHQLRAMTGSWVEAAEQIRSKGSTVTAQSVRTWAVGTTIGPDDGKDVFRVGRSVGDEFLQKEWRRVNEMMTEVRRLHVRLGHLLSAALQEARDGHGPNLEKLSALIHVDVTEVLEEFEVRTVRKVGPSEYVRASLLGKVTKP